MRRTTLGIVSAVCVAGLVWQARGVVRAEPVPAAGAPEAAATAGWIRAEGRLVTYPGGEATLSPEVEGRIVRLAVEEGTRVRAGQLLVELSSEEERAALAEALARRTEAEAALRLAESEAARGLRLAEARVISTRGLEQSLHERDLARAGWEVAEAAVQRLEARVAKSRIVAPLDGVVITREVEPGETVAPGQALLTIADLGRTRVEAEVDEFDAARLRVGARVTVRGEGYRESWRGRVEEIPPAVTARRLRPLDPARPTDTRVLIVKVVLEEATPLRLGQRVEVEIEGGAR